MKVRKIMMVAVIVVGVLVVLAGGNIMRQNSKPQVALGMKGDAFHEIPTKPNCVSTQTSQDDKKVEPLPFKSSLEASKDAIKKAFEAYGSIEIKEENRNYIYAVATTGTMKYHDDIEIYFDEAKQEVHYRSASRAGYSDMGLNRSRYDEIAKSYNEE